MPKIFYAMLAPDPDGGLLCTFPDVPAAITHGETREEALANAREALGMALLGYVHLGQAIPVPKVHRKGFPVSPLAADAAKLAVITAFNEAGISKSELARRLGKTETEARRILDPHHPTKLATLDEAVAALGKQMVISLEPAA